VRFDSNVKDGRRALGLAVPNSNRRNPLDTPPFLAFAVTSGTTFTFGGLRVRPSGEVISTDGTALCGLDAAGELVGGLFYILTILGNGTHVRRGLPQAFWILSGSDRNRSRPRRRTK
jgi:predicted oxidoreductase